MARPLAFAVALVGVVSLFPAAQGCTSDATSCTYVYATSYDQSCITDSDCVGVVDGMGCCPNSSVNVAAQAQFMADFQKAFAAGCGAHGCTEACGTAGPCCVGGTCQFTTAQECHPPTPVTDAGADTGADADGPAACVAAGGECLVGGSNSICAVVGPQDCNPDRDPGGQYCCLQKAGVADAAPESGADADACAPSGCSTACPAGTQDVSSMVNGCLVWQCCVPSAAGRDGGPLDAAGE
jgi:hypothetical protein